MPRENETAIMQGLDELKRQIQEYEESERKNANLGENIIGDYRVFSDTEEFKTFKTELENLVKKTEQYYKMDFNGKYKTMDEADIKLLIVQYSRLNEAMTSMKAAMSKPEAAIRYEKNMLAKFSGMLDNTQKLINQDMSVLSVAKAPADLPDLVMTGRTRRVVLKENFSEKDYVGEKMSSRIPVKFTDENNVVHEGFFTEDTRTDYKPTLKEIININIDWLVQDLFEKQKIINPQYQEEIKGYFKAIFMDIIDNSPIGDEPEEFLKLLELDLTHVVIEERVNNKGVKRKVRTTLDENRIFAYLAYPDLLPDYLDKEVWNELISDKDLKNATQHQKDLLQGFKLAFAGFDLQDFVRILCNGIKSDAMDSISNFRNHKYEFYISNKSSIVQRNAAMSAVADVLGIGHIVAHSENMTLNVNGVDKKGVFMDNAQGENINRLKKGSKLLGISRNFRNKPDYDPYSVEVKKDLYNLQVLDFLCNNVDRHMGNIMFKVNDAQDKIIGIQGIDNDASFGTYVRDVDNCDYDLYEITLENMLYVPQSMAATLRALDPNILKLALQGFDLSEKERNAVVERLEVLKNAIFKEKKIKILSDADFEKLKFKDEIAKVPTHQVETGEGRNKHFSDKRIYSQTEQFAILPSSLGKRKVKDIVFKDASFSKGKVMQPKAYDDLKTQQLTLIKRDIGSFETKYESLSMIIREFGSGDEQLELMQANLNNLIQTAKVTEYCLEKSNMNIPFGYIDEYNRELKKMNATLDAVLVDAKASEYVKLNAQALKIYSETQLNALEEMMKAHDDFDKHNIITYDEVKDEMDKIKDDYGKNHIIDQNTFARWKLFSELKDLGPEGVKKCNYDKENFALDVEKISVNNASFNTSKTFVDTYMKQTNKNVTVTAFATSYKYMEENITPIIGKLMNNQLTTEEAKNTYNAFRKQFGNVEQIAEEIDSKNVSFTDYVAKMGARSIESSLKICFKDIDFEANYKENEARENAKIAKENAIKDAKKAGFEIIEKADVPVMDNPIKK